MSNFVLGWRNNVFVDTGGVVSLYVGTLDAGVMSNLADMRLSKRVSLSASAPSGFPMSIVIKWIPGTPADTSIQLFGLLNYELTVVNAAYDEVQVMLVIVSPDDSEGSGTSIIPVWNGPSSDFPRHLWHLLDTPLSACTEVALLITAVAGVGDGTLTLTAGALWAGPIWAPPDGIEATWSQAIIDPGKMARSPGGQGYPRTRQRYRTFEGRAIHLPFTWAFGDPDDATILDVQQLLYRVGTTQPIALFPRTWDSAGAVSTHVIHRLGMYCHLVDTGRIEHLGGDLYQWSGVKADELM